MARKGQGVPIDFMAGLFIFLVMLAYFFIQWDGYSRRYAEHASLIGMETAAIGMADRLVSFGGSPDNWTSDPLSAESIGLARRQNELDECRIAALSSLPYANARLLLGTGRDFVIKIETADRGRLYTLGAEPGNASRAVEVTRVAELNGSVVDVRVQVYEN